MQRPIILILSDAEQATGLDAERESEILRAVELERAAEILASHPVRAVCLDRADVEVALADARWLRKRRNGAPVFAVVDTHDIQRAAELFACGVEEVVLRQGEPLLTLRERLRQLERESDPLGVRGAQGLVARSPAMRACLELVAKAQRSSASVLVTGETGTGKEVVARLIHDGGPRASAPFVGLNCAAFPETLLESELFGYERGAFTGATRSKRGHFASASGGTLFLDEIGETALGFQVKLLRALQEGIVRPLGATHEIPVDVRVIAATNRTLHQEVEAGRFRRDLFYRLNVFPIELPPLRSRIEDVVPLAELFLSRHAAGPKGVAPDAARLLEMHAWPGNVRELENEVARIVAHAGDAAEVTARMLSPEIQGQSVALPSDASSETLRDARSRFEAWYIRNALRRNAGRRLATARSLGITRECLYN